MAASLVVRAELTSISTDGVHRELVLSFDGGPYYEEADGHVSHAALLQKLLEHDARAVFFLTGAALIEDPDVLYRMRDEGHCVGSLGHRGLDLGQVTDRDSVQNELFPMQKIVLDVLGSSPQFYRAAGDVNATVLDALSANGLALCGFAQDAPDLSISDPQAFADDLLGRIQDGDIVRLRPTQDTLAMLDVFLPALKAEGWFLSLPRTHDAPMRASIVQNFSAWVGKVTSNQNLATARTDLAGSGFKWRARVTNGRAFFRRYQDFRFDGAPGVGGYAYTHFDRSGASAPDQMIDLSGQDAALEIDFISITDGIQFKALIFDGRSWYLSGNNFSPSGNGEYRNLLRPADAGNWLLVNESSDLMNGGNPALTFSADGSPDLKRIQGFGLYLSESTDADAARIHSMSAFRDLKANCVDSGYVVDRPLERNLFGICATSYQEKGLNAQIQAEMSKWVELMRLPGGSNIEGYNLKHAFNYNGSGGTNISARDWVERSRDSVNSNMDFIFGVSSTLGMDSINVPSSIDPNVSPEVINPGLSGWANHPQYQTALPRGVDYAKDVVQSLNSEYDQSWGQNAAKTESARVKYIEVGNEVDLELASYGGRVGSIMENYYNPVYREYAEAIHALDASVQLLGPSTTKGNIAQNMHEFLEGNGDIVDVVSTHRYSNAAHLYRQDIETIKYNIRRFGQDSERRRKDQIGIAYTEYNTSGSGDIAETDWEKALVLGSYLTVFMSEGIDLATIWHVDMGGGHGLFKQNSNGTWWPTSANYPFRFFRQHIDFSKKPRPVRVSHQSNGLFICGLRQDDALKLFVVNPVSTGETIHMQLAGDSYLEEYSASTMLEGSNGEWAIGVSGESSGVLDANGNLSYTFPAESLVVIKLLRDSDTDGMVNGDEIRAGTDFLDAQSLMRIKQISWAEGVPSIQWSSVAGKTYNLQFSTDLKRWGAVPELHPIAALSDVTTATDPTPPGSSAFYRITVNTE